MPEVKEMVKKICKITNAQLTWILEVDGKKIAFSGFDNADYFEEHYKKLGYEVIRENTWKENEK